MIELIQIIQKWDALGLLINVQDTMDKKTLSIVYEKTLNRMITEKVNDSFSTMALPGMYRVYNGLRIKNDFNFNFVYEKLLEHIKSDEIKKWAVENDKYYSDIDWEAEFLAEKCEEIIKELEN